MATPILPPAFTAITPVEVSRLFPVGVEMPIDAAVGALAPAVERIAANLEAEPVLKIVRLLGGEAQR